MTLQRIVVAAATLVLAAAGCSNGARTPLEAPSDGPELVSVPGDNPDGPHVLWHPGGPAAIERATYDQALPAALVAEAATVAVVLDPWTRAIEAWGDGGPCRDALDRWLVEDLLQSGGLATQGDVADACGLGQERWGLAHGGYATAVEGFVASGELPRDYIFVAASFGTTLGGALQQSAAPPTSVTFISPVPTQTELVPLLRDRVEATATLLGGSAEELGQRTLDLAGVVYDLLETPPAHPVEPVVDLALGWQASAVASEALTVAEDAFAGQLDAALRLRRLGQGARYAVGDGRADIGLVGYLDAMCATWPYGADVYDQLEVQDALVGLHRPCIAAPPVRPPPAAMSVDCVVVSRDDAVTGGYVPELATSVTFVDLPHGSYATCSSG